MYNDRFISLLYKIKNNLYTLHITVSSRTQKITNLTSEISKLTDCPYNELIYIWNIYLFFSCIYIRQTRRGENGRSRCYASSNDSRRAGIDRADVTGWTRNTGSSGCSEWNDRWKASQFCIYTSDTSRLVILSHDDLWIFSKYTQCFPIETSRGKGKWKGKGIHVSLWIPFHFFYRSFIISWWSVNFQ